MNSLCYIKDYQNGFGCIHGERAPDFFQAFKELNDGKKKSHWSWYILPSNKPSRTFGTKFMLNQSERMLFLTDRTLRYRYYIILKVICEHLKQGKNVLELLMSKKDVMRCYDSALSFYDSAVILNDIKIKDMIETVLLALDPFVEHIRKTITIEQTINPMLNELLQKTNNMVC